MNIESKQMSQMTKSAEAVASNDDLSTQILLRVSFTSSLYPNTGSPSLAIPISVSSAALPLSHHPAYSFPSLLSVTQSTSIYHSSVSPKLNLTFDPDHFGIQILQSCNGLLFCSSSQGPTPYTSYYIYNPTTKQHTTLPPLSGNTSSPRTAIGGMILAFDPSQSPHYKVICVRGAGLGRNLYQIVIYSSETRLWRESGQPFMTETTPSFERGVYWNGAIHWANPPLYFQINEEQSEKMPMPPLPDRWNEGSGPSYFGESNGHLHFVETYGPGTTQLNVYEMERDYSGWNVKYQVDLGEVPNVYPEMVRVDLEPMSRDYYALVVAHFVRREREQDSFLVLEIPSKALRYNIVDKSFEKLCDYPPLEGALDLDESRLRYGCDCAYEYMESLAGV